MDTFSHNTEIQTGKSACFQAREMHRQIFEEEIIAFYLSPVNCGYTQNGFINTYEVIDKAFTQLLICKGHSLHRIFNVTVSKKFTTQRFFAVAVL